MTYRFRIGEIVWRDAGDHRAGVVVHIPPAAVVVAPSARAHPERRSATKEGSQGFERLLGPVSLALLRAWRGRADAEVPIDPDEAFAGVPEYLVGLLTGLAETHHLRTLG